MIRITLTHPNQVKYQVEMECRQSGLFIMLIKFNELGLPCSSSVNFDVISAKVGKLITDGYACVVTSV